MSYFFHPEAEAEFEAAVAWYEARATGLGLDFTTELWEAIRLAEAMPLAWPLMEPDIRRVLLNRFPYGVLYALDEDRLHILAASCTCAVSQATGWHDWRRAIEFRARELDGVIICRMGGGALCRNPSNFWRPTMGYGACAPPPILRGAAQVSPLS